MISAPNDDSRTVIIRIRLSVLPKLSQTSAVLAHAGTVLTHVRAILTHATAILAHATAILTHATTVLAHASAVLARARSVLTHAGSVVGASAVACIRIASTVVRACWIVAARSVVGVTTGI